MLMAIGWSTWGHKVYCRSHSAGHCFVWGMTFCAQSAWMSDNLGFRVTVYAYSTITIAYNSVDYLISYTDHHCNNDFEFDENFQRNCKFLYLMNSLDMVTTESVGINNRIPIRNSLKYKFYSLYVSKFLTGRFFILIFLYNYSEGVILQFLICVLRICTQSSF